MHTRFQKLGSQRHISLRVLSPKFKVQAHTCSRTDAISLQPWPRVYSHTESPSGHLLPGNCCYLIMAEEDELKKVIGKRVQFVLESLWYDLSTKDWSPMATSKTGENWTWVWWHFLSPSHFGVNDTVRGSTWSCHQWSGGGLRLGVSSRVEYSVIQLSFKKQPLHRCMLYSCVCVSTVYLVWQSWTLVHMRRIWCPIFRFVA